MNYKTKGFVLHTVNFNDTSIIVKIYTKNYGLQSYLVRGVRKQKSVFKQGLFQHLSLVEFVATQPSKKSLHYIKEIKSFYHFKTIPFEIKKSSVLLFINEVLYRSLNEDGVNIELFEFVVKSIEYFDHLSEHYSDFHLFFLIHLTKYLGFYPLNNYSEINNIFDLKEGRFVEATAVLPYFMNERLSKLFHLYLQKNNIFDEHTYISITSYEDLKDLLNLLIQYYQLHMDGFNHLKSLKVLHDLFN